MLKSTSKVTINTGNVLNLIDIKKKAGQNVTEELSESIKLTLSEWSTNNSLVTNGTPQTSQLLNPSPVSDSDYVVVSTSQTHKDAVFNISRQHDDVQTKIAEEERKNLKIGVKIFINEENTVGLKECMSNVFKALSTDYIDNVTLAYSPATVLGTRSLVDVNMSHNKSSPINLSGVGKMGGPESDSDVDVQDQRKCDLLMPGIKVLWAVLEDYVQKGHVHQLGAADVGLSCLRMLHSWSQVKPSIAQINLATCCVVPPQLQEFCKLNDVQLLTHADPPDLLSTAAAKSISETGINFDNMEWCARYQVHIKCRGVLALKGYVCKATIGKGAHTATPLNIVDTQ